MKAHSQRPLSVVVVAAGEARRMAAGVRKPWLTVAGDAVVAHTVRRFASLDITREIVLVVHPDDLPRAESLRERFADLAVTAGGATRVASVRNGLALVAPDADLIAVHDGVRPLVTEDVIRRVVERAREIGAAIPVVPVRATLKEVEGEGDRIVRTAPRERLFEAQTPQVFRAELLRRAYEKAADTDDVTDDAQLVERLGLPVATVPGSVHNIKITTPEDLKLAEILLAR